MCFQIILCVRAICARSAFVIGTITSPRNALDGTDDLGAAGVTLGLRGICARTMNGVKNRAKRRRLNI